MMYKTSYMSLYGKKSTLATLDEAHRELDYIRAAFDRAAIVAVTDAKGTIIHVNEKFCEISKYSREELIGQNHRIINSGYHSKEFFEDLWSTISSGKVWENEVRNRAKDGSYYWVYTTIVPFLDENKKPYQYVSIRFEITRIKNAENKLTEYTKRLETSNRELQDFAAIAAHDLQEPLRKIITFSERFGAKFSAHIPAEGLDYLKRIQSSAIRMRTLIDDLLSYSRVHTKTLPFNPVNLQQIVTDVLSDLEVKIEQTNAKITVGELPTLDADPSQMRQLFQNVIGNALKFHKPEQAPVLNISAQKKDQDYEITIVDNGIGFEEKYLDRIFNIFQRLHGRHEYEGTGVGLAIVRRIAERHGGSVTASSTLGEGAKFIIRIPCVQNNEDL